MDRQRWSHTPGLDARLCGAGAVGAGTEREAGAWLQWEEWRPLGLVPAPTSAGSGSERNNPRKVPASWRPLAVQPPTQAGALPGRPPHPSPPVLPTTSFASGCAALSSSRRARLSGRCQAQRGPGSSSSRAGRRRSSGGKMGSTAGGGSGGRQAPGSGSLSERSKGQGSSGGETSSTAGAGQGVTAALARQPQRGSEKARQLRNENKLHCGRQGQRRRHRRGSPDSCAARAGRAASSPPAPPGASGSPSPATQPAPTPCAPTRGPRVRQRAARLLAVLVLAGRGDPATGVHLAAAVAGAAGAGAHAPARRPAAAIAAAAAAAAAVAV